MYTNQLINFRPPDLAKRSSQIRTLLRDKAAARALALQSCGLSDEAGGDASDDIRTRDQHAPLITGANSGDERTTVKGASKDSVSPHYPIGVSLNSLNGRQGQTSSVVDLPRSKYPNSTDAKAFRNVDEDQPWLGHAASLAACPPPEDAASWRQMLEEERAARVALECQFNIFVELMANDQAVRTRLERELVARLVGVRGSGGSLVPRSTQDVVSVPGKTMRSAREPLIGTPIPAVFVAATDHLPRMETRSGGAEQGGPSPEQQCRAQSGECRQVGSSGHEQLGHVLKQVRMPRQPASGLKGGFWCLWLGL